MDSIRTGPWCSQPNVRPADVVYLGLSGNWDEFRHEIPEWFRQWRGLDDWQLKLEELLCLELCPVLAEFTRRLFDTILPCGIMHCKVTHRKEPTRTWLVFCKRTQAHRRYSIKHLAKADPGDFYYLQKPEGYDLSFISETLVRRFFASYGRLRDSCPFFGYDGFVSVPSAMDQQTHRSCYLREVQWHDIRCIHIRKLDYLVMNDRGQVGYMPIEPERPIQLYAESFGDAILKWLHDPLRDWYALSCQ